MNEGNGLPNTADTRARLRGLSILDRTLAEQRNVNAAPPPETTPSRSMRVEAGMRAIEEAEREREDLRNALQSCEADLRGVRAEHDALQAAYTRCQNDMATYRADRDLAVKELATIEAVYDAVLTIMQKHRAVNPEDYGATPEDER